VNGPAARIRVPVAFLSKEGQDCLPLLQGSRRLGATGYELHLGGRLAPVYTTAGDANVAESVRDLMRVAVALFDPPDDPNLLLLSLPLVETILRSALAPPAGTLPQNAMGCLRKILVTSGAVASAPAPQALVGFLYGAIQKYPLFAMHVLGGYVQWRGMEPRWCIVPPPAYRVYGRRCHDAARKAEARYDATGHSHSARLVFLEEMRALRYFLQTLVVVQGPVPDARPKGRPREDELARVRNNLAECLDLRQREGDRDPDRPVDYVRLLRQLLCGAKKGIGHPVLRQHQPRRAGSEPAPSIQIPETHWPEQDETGPAELSEVDQLMAFPSIDPENLQEGEAADDYGTDLIEVRPRIADRRTVRRAARRIFWRMDRDAIGFVYRREKAQLFEYAIAYRAVAQSARGWLPISADGRNFAPAALAVLSIVHLGIGAEALLGSRWRRVGQAASHTADDALNGAHSKRVYFDPTDLCLWRPMPTGWTGYVADQSRPGAAAMEPVAPVIRVELAPFLREELAHVRHTWRALTKSRATPPPLEDRVFLVLGGGRVRAFTRTDLAKFLRISAGSHPGRLLRRLEESFFALYVDRLGLDPATACYVAGAAPRRFTTQLAYRHIRYGEFVSDYHDAARAADALIRQEAGLAARVRAPVRTRVIQTNPKIRPGLGSRIFPRHQHITRFTFEAHALLGELAATQDPMLRFLYHRRFTALAWLVLHLATGVRPSRDREFIAALEGPDPGRIQIQDKDSTKTAEVRTLLRTPLLRKQIAQCAAARASMERDWRFDRVRFCRIGRPLLFMVTDEGRPAVARGRAVRREIQEWPDLERHFPYPLNVGRHLIETALANVPGIDIDAKDYGLGHQRSWREVPNRFSAAEVPQVEAHYARRVHLAFAGQELAVIPFTLAEIP
jgi:hypothetical protein